MISLWIRILIIYHIFYIIVSIHVIVPSRYRSLALVKDFAKKYHLRRLLSYKNISNTSVSIISNIHTHRFDNNATCVDEDLQSDDFEFNEMNSSKGMNPGSMTTTSTKTRLLKNAEGILKSTRQSNEQMTYIQTMFTGAMSRTIAQTVMHPVNTYKTMLQLNR